MAFRFFKGLLFGLILSVSLPAQAALQVDITRGNVDPMPIAVVDFADSRSMGANIGRVIRDNLERSGLFEPVEPRAFLQQAMNVTSVPEFPNWRKISAQALVVGSVDAVDGKLTASFRLWDVLTEKQTLGKSYTVSEKNWRRVAHMISDDIYERITGEEGYFDTRIVYIAESGDRKRKTKKLAIMDQDGANQQFLTSGKSLALTPRFSPSSQKIIYLSYHKKVPSVYLYDLETGSVETLGNFPGMSFAPRFSHDGRKAIMSVSLNGNSEIFELDINTRSSKRLTNDPSIDTSPSYSPDGKQIVFNSDRGGSQQLYVMSADGGNVRRISFGDGKYGTPVWSPRGDLIAFTKMKGGMFHIGVMRIDGSGERLLTQSYLDEGPTWSPNGRVLMFMRQSRPGGGSPSRTMLYSIDLTGYNERLIKTTTEASDPAWSPLLQ